MDSPFLAPIEKPKSLFWKVLYFFTRRRFGKVITPLKVMAVRLPVAFGLFSNKIGQLDKKLQLSAETVMLVRERVAQLNGCLFCIDIGRALTIRSAMNQAKFEALPHYQSSTLFTEEEKVLLDFVTRLTRDRTMEADLFNRLAQHYDDRSICEIVWLVATEFYYNIGNIGLNIHSDMLCDMARKKGHQPATELV